jgi:sulfur-carrier protein adenylyltransferase/sulfurtransferase
MPKSLADFVKAALKTVPEVSPEFVRRRALKEGWRIFDVRELDEIQAGMIPGSEHYPRGFLEVRADLKHPKRDLTLEQREQKIVCYCGGGHRSALAAKALQQMGFTNVASMEGGWSAWMDAEYPISRPNSLK